MRRRVRIEGAEHLRAALAKGKRRHSFSAHFTTFEFYWPALRPLCTRLCGMYKWQRNPVMNEMMNRGRGRYFDDVVREGQRPRRCSARCVEQLRLLWYASDQSYTGKGSASAAVLRRARDDEHGDRPNRESQRRGRPALLLPAARESTAT